MHWVKSEHKNLSVHLLYTNFKMTETEFVFDPENKIDQRHGYYMFFGSILFFGTLNIIAQSVEPPSSVKGDPWRWNNLLISWVHGFSCGTWDILCFYLYPELLDNLVHHINYFTYLMVAFSAGYFVYDFIDLLVKRKIIGNWEITIHHIAVISMFWYNFHCRMCIGYNVVALLAEVNSFFLHSRKLLHMLNFKFDGKFYRTVCLLNLVTFLYCRGWSLFRIAFGMFTEYYRVPRYYYYCLSLSIFILSVINPILFFRLLKSDVFRYWWPSSNKKSVTPVLNGNSNKGSHIKLG